MPHLPIYKTSKKNKLRKKITYGNFEMYIVIEIFTKLKT